MDTLEKAGTWSTVSRPLGTNVVGSEWVFHIKRSADGSMANARLVSSPKASLIHGVDYFDIYLPVARLTSFRVILAFAMCRE
jgi:hypothetical protein